MQSGPTFKPATVAPRATKNAKNFNRPSTMPRWTCHICHQPNNPLANTFASIFASICEDCWIGTQIGSAWLAARKSGTSVSPSIAKAVLTGIGKAGVMMAVGFERPARPRSKDVRSLARALWMAEEKRARESAGMVGG